MADSLTPETDVSTAEVSGDEMARLKAWLNGDERFKPQLSGQTNMPDIRNAPAVPAGQLVSPAQSELTAFTQAATRPGVPLDTATGAPGVERFVAGLEKDKTAELEHWRNLYGEDKIAVVEGKFVIRDFQDPETGEVKDLLVDEEKMTAKDLLHVMGELPELALSIAATRRFGGTGLIRQAVVGAGAYSGTGALKDVLSRSATDRPIDPSTIAKERGAEAGVDAAVGVLLPGAVRGVVNSVRSPFGVTPGILPQLNRQGRLEIAKRTGIELPASLAEITGSQAVADAESFLSKIPFARERIMRRREAQIEAERHLQEFMMAGPEQRAGDIGERAIGVLGQTVSPQQQAVETARRAAITSASQETIGAIQAAGGGRRGISALDLGTSTQSGVQQRFNDFKLDSKTRFTALYELPETKEDIWPLKPVADRADELLKKLPSTPAKPTEEITVDAYGSPMVRQVPPGEGERELITEVIPAQLRSMLEKLSGRSKDKTRLFDLVQARDRIWDMIGQPQVMPDIPKGDLKQLSSAITQAIHEGAQKIDNPEVAKRLLDANKFYKEGIARFEGEGIQNLLVPEGQPNNVNVEGIVNSLFAGGKGSVKRFQTLKEFFGPQSTEIADIKQYFLDNMLEKGVDPVTRTADFKDVLASMQKLAPEMRTELFGSGADNISEAARLGLVAEGKVPIDEVQGLIQSNQLTRANVKQLMDEQEALDKLLKSQVNKAVAEGFVDRTKINPDEFVDRYLLDKSVPLKDVQGAIQAIAGSDPALLADVRRKALSDIFRQVQRTGVRQGVGGEDLARRVLGDRTREIDPQKLSLLFDNPQERERLESILGSNQYEILRNYALAVGTRAKTEGVSNAAGSFAKGALMSDVLTGMKGVKDISKYWVASLILTNERMQKFMITRKSPLEMRRAMQALSMTPEFARALVDDFPDDLERERIATELKEAWAEGEER